MGCSTLAAIARIDALVEEARLAAHADQRVRRDAAHRLVERHVAVAVAIPVAELILATHKSVVDHE